MILTVILTCRVRSIRNLDFSEPCYQMLIRVLHLRNTACGRGFYSRIIKINVPD